MKLNQKTEITLVENSQKCQARFKLNEPFWSISQVTSSPTISVSCIMDQTRWRSYWIDTCRKRKELGQWRKWVLDSSMTHQHPSWGAESLLRYHSGGWIPGAFSSMMFLQRMPGKSSRRPDSNKNLKIIIQLLIGDLDAIQAMLDKLVEKQKQQTEKQRNDCTRPWWFLGEGIVQFLIYTLFFFSIQLRLLNLYMKSQFSNSLNLYGLIFGLLSLYPLNVWRCHQFPP